MNLNNINIYSKKTGWCCEQIQVLYRENSWFNYNQMHRHVHWLDIAQFALLAPLIFFH